MPRPLIALRALVPVLFELASSPRCRTMHSRCDSPRVTKIRLLAKDLRTEPHDPAIDADLARLIDASQERCHAP